MSSNSSNSSKGLGNTKPVPKQISPAKRWCFTLNNYTEQDISSISSKIYDTCDKSLVSKEVGESGTPHLQGFISLKTKARPMAVFDNKRIHWEAAKGNNDAQLTYISKQNQPFLSLGFPKPVKLINPDYDWEQQILGIVTQEPDDRTIYWYWSKGGNKGKTSFCKYLTVKHGAIALSGKAADMRNGVIDYQKTNGFLPELVLIPIPKSFNTDYLNYEGIENIKDMYFYSGKYEGGQVCGNPPHLFVFANEPPDTSKMSLDRWKVIEIL
ncbi:hypothetical protein [Shewanella sp.]|uniref:hypothetical protein n=2 Tax=Shewanella sp. TaxID=50422 RepID=UPI00404769FA